MRVLAVVLFVSCIAGCDDTASLLAEGHVADACAHSATDPAQRAIFERWLVDNAPLRLHVVPQTVIDGALGGPVRLDAGEVVYDATVAVPEAAVVAASDVASDAPLNELVLRLPPLVVADRAPKPAAIDQATLAPTPRASSSAHAHGGGGSFISQIIEGSFAVGEVVGTAIAMPFVAVGSVVAGIAGVFGAIFGGGGGGDAVPAPERLPIERLAVVDGTAVDALLFEAEVDVAVAALSAEHAAIEAAVRAERARRLALVDDVNVLDPGDCRTGRCRVLLREPPTSTEVVVGFSRETLFGTRSCSATWPAPVVVEPAKTASHIAGAPPVAVGGIDAARAFAQLTTPLHPRAPSWAMQHSAALASTKQKPAPKQKPFEVDRIADLACTVRVKQLRFDVDGSAPDLLVRATVGRERSRATSLALGTNVKEARFVVHGVELQPRERVRLSFASEGDRSLGGAVVTFDGTAPLVLENAAFRAVCAPFDNVDAAVVADAVRTADVAIATLANDRSGVDSPRPDYAVHARHERAAEAAVVAVAALVGFSDDVVAPLLTAIEAARH